MTTTRFLDVIVLLALIILIIMACKSMLDIKNYVKDLIREKKPQKSPPCLKAEGAEAVSMFALIIDDINQMKNRHWVITNYVLLLMAAIVGFCRLVDPKNSGIPEESKMPLLLLAFCIAFMGSYFLFSFQRALLRYRQRLDCAYEQLPPALQHIWGPLKSSKNYLSFRYCLFETVIAFVLIQWIAALLVAWFLYRN